MAGCRYVLALFAITVLSALPTAHDVIVCSSADNQDRSGSRLRPAVTVYPYQSS